MHAQEGLGLCRDLPRQSRLVKSAHMAVLVRAVALSGCLQVLKSHMIPATATDEQVSDLLRAMPEHPGMYNKIVDALFAESGSSGVDDPTGVVTRSSDGGLKPEAEVSANIDIAAAGVPVAGHSAVQLSIMRCVERVCSAHSCLQMQSRVVCCFC